MVSVPFSFFVTIWNRMQNQQTPDVHFQIAEWFSDCFDTGDDRLLLMAFRGCGKSTLVGLLIVWALYCNPDLRVLVVSADQELAMRMVRNVRRIIERHPLTDFLLPDAPDQWAADRFTVKRPSELRDPSVVSCGLHGNYTGMRADLIIVDDAEVPGTSETAVKREELRSRLHELNFVGSAQSRIIYVGTPHTFDTIYETKVRPDLPGHLPFLQGYRMLKIPAVTAKGIAVWPEKYSLLTLEKMKKTSGLSRFQSQMMLEPVQIIDSYLDPGLLQVYDDDLVPVKELGHLYLGSVQLVSCSAWWDPALARGHGDGSVLAIIFTDADGHVYVHRVIYLRIDQHCTDDDAAQQCIQVAQALKEFFVPVVGLEVNGIGRFLPPILRREIVRTRAVSAVVEINHTQAKNKRILQSFEAPMAARMLHVHRSVLQTRFIDELRDFRPDRDSKYDDGLDAVAGAMALEPLRIKQVGSGMISRPFWRSGSIYHVKNNSII